jgi:hypothetical protein
LGCVCGYVSGSVTQLYDRKLEIAWVFYCAQAQFVDLCITPLFNTLQKKQAVEPYSNFVKGRSSFNGPERVSCTFGLAIF